MTPAERSKQWRRTNKWRYNKYQREYQEKLREKNLSRSVETKVNAEADRLKVRIRNSLLKNLKLMNYVK